MKLGALLTLLGITLGVNSEPLESPVRLRISTDYVKTYIKNRDFAIFEVFSNVKLTTDA